MTIAFPHFFRSMADPRVDQTLVDAFHGAVAAEGVAEAVPDWDDCPLAVEQHSVEVLVGFAWCDWHRLFTRLTAVHDVCQAKCA